MLQETLRTIREKWGRMEEEEREEISCVEGTAQWHVQGLGVTLNTVSKQ